MAASQRILLGHVKGDKGDTGDKGDNATINVVGTTTTAPGTPAQVVQGGTETARTLTFHIPRGEPGGGGVAITPARSTTMPLLYRLRIRNPNYGLTHPGFQGGSYEDYREVLYPQEGALAPFVCALDMQGVDSWVWYFTTHGTRGLIKGWKSTVYTPQPQPYMFQAPEACPINFGSAGYRGNWSNRQRVWDYAPGSYPSLTSILYLDYDGLVFTSTRTALWVRYRQPGPPLGFEMSVITLSSLPTGTITALWAAKQVTTHPYGQAYNYSAHWIYVVIGAQLFLAHWEDGQTGSVAQLSIQRRITGPESFQFNVVTDPAFGTIGTNTRVYAERNMAAVWGFTNVMNRIAFFDGTQWHAITIPFSFASNYTKNSVVIYPDGRLGIFNSANGDYYTCANPTDPTPQIVLRYRVAAYYLMTRGFMLGTPQFVPRNAYSDRGVYCEFDSTTHDGGKCFAAVHNRGHWQDFYWPDELWCSTDRPDIVCSPSYYLGYAYAYGTRHESISVQGDGQTAQAVTTMYGKRLLNVPMMLQGCEPPVYFAASSHRQAATTGNDAQMRAMTVFAGHPVTIA